MGNCRCQGGFVTGRTAAHPCSHPSVLGAPYLDKADSVLGGVARKYNPSAKVPSFWTGPHHGRNGLSRRNERKGSRASSFHGVSRNNIFPAVDECTPPRRKWRRPRWLHNPTARSCVKGSWLNRLVCGDPAQQSRLVWQRFYVILFVGGCSHRAAAGVAQPAVTVLRVATQHMRPVMLAGCAV